jgi:hypothetical protein
LGTGGVKKIFKGFLRESKRDTGHRQGQGQGGGQKERQELGEGCEKKIINLNVEQQQQQQHKQQQHEEEDEILPHHEAAAFIQHPHDQCCSSSSSSSSKDDGNDNDNNMNTTSNDESSSAGVGEGVGVGGIHSFKQHCFFKDVPWGRLLDRPVPANFSAPLGPLNQSSSSEVECYENFTTNLYYD